MTEIRAREGSTVTAVLGRFRLEPNPQGPWLNLARLFRSAVANIFSGDPAFHGHQDNRSVLRYPAVQYRWEGPGPRLFAHGEAAQRAINYSWPGTRLTIGDSQCQVCDVEWAVFPLTLEPTNKLKRYTFVTPWLALNQENYRRYKKMSSSDRRAELDRVLVGNLLSLFKGLGWILPPERTVFAAVESPRDTPCSYKGVSLIGFRAGFVTNFELPRAVAIGRAVSHGFGWVERYGKPGE